MRSVITIGEPLLPATRASIEEAFRCAVFERYSASEVGLIAGECESHRLHINVGSLYVERFALQGCGPRAAGEPGRLVVTDLFNFGMPFIRYELEDEVVLDEDTCPCGRLSPLVKAIHGRVLDRITTPQGGWIDSIGVGGVLVDIREIRQFQFVQRTRRAYLVRVVAERDFDEKVAQRIVNRYRQVLGPSALIQVERVKEIPPLPSGKRPYVLCEARRAYKDGM